MAERLDEATLARALKTLENWAVNDEGKLQRTWKLDDFDAAMNLIHAIADVARDLDHHPELFNVYDQVRVELTTHDAGGLTQKDVDFAHRANALT